MRDFTIAVYKKFVEILIKKDYQMTSFIKFIDSPGTSSIILRHDVDRFPLNSLKFAQIQSEMGIRSTYYFRKVPQSFDPGIITEIARLGHEIGYHYEDVSLVSERCQASGIRHQEETIVKLAIESFAENLEKLRKAVPVRTICMHGSPLSKWDSRLLWKYYDYHDFGIVGEPYFDIDFDIVLYLTDTGRRWDGEKVSVRDKVQGTGHRAQGENQFEGWKVKPVKYRSKIPNFNLPLTHSHSHTFSPSPQPLSSEALAKEDLPFLQSFHSTFDIIRATHENNFPSQTMLTFHPQRWTDQPIPWIKELIWQNTKNIGKYFLVKIR